MTYDVHPAALVFPMLPGDELRALADDIAAYGLRQPIVRTPGGEILDGRNRLAACRLAKRRPRFVEYDGDPWAYVVSANLKRRDLSKSQRAVMAAKALPHYREEAAARKASGKKVPKGRGGKASEVAGRAFGVNAKYVEQAAVVLERQPELAEQIMSSKLASPDRWSDIETMTLARAYYDVTESERRAEQKKRTADSRTWRAKFEAERATALAEAEKRQAEYAEALERAAVAFGVPADIRTQVELHVLTPDEAQEQAEERNRLGIAMSRFVTDVVDVAEESSPEDLALRLHLYAENVETPEYPISFEALEEAAKTLAGVVDEWRKLR